ncbi:hypothetical protein ACZ87_01284 [Candidatus Erwinia dacicola]|uniref:Uncharacterized protein n=1 Tax=Candidatus Erwinia dacicola TaxID=252393 RepID=A0A328TR48_9GAMM|nr:hypothetical protein ACZ87_01284 [Candidatus Erwinia dacicola]
MLEWLSFSSKTVILKQHDYLLFNKASVYLTLWGMETIAGARRTCYCEL